MLVVVRGSGSGCVGGCDCGNADEDESEAEELLVPPPLLMEG